MVTNTFALTALSIMASTTLEYAVVYRIIKSDDTALKRWARMMVVGLLLVFVTIIILLSTKTDWRQGILGINVGAVVGGVKALDDGSEERLGG
jgi:multisubunit Na+/H+ antiporter MnhB subunit